MMIKNTHEDCSCTTHNHNHNHQHSKEEITKPKDDLKLQSKNNKVDHIITLMQTNFISPFKILFMIDPKQADHYQLRNKSQGCCASNQITIEDQFLSKTQKYLKECLQYSYLKNNLDKIMSYSYERFNNILENGKKDNLEVTDDVQKYILNKVLMESINHYIFMQISQKIKEESLRFNKQIGLWATPATWIQKYPKEPLNFLDNQAINQLITKRWSFMKDFYVKSQQLMKQLVFLQKDGKFEESMIENGQIKILNNPQSFIDAKNSKNELFFVHLRQISKKIGSIPFEFNYKANLYCTVSPNLHILYSNKPFVMAEEEKQLKFTVLLPFGGKITLKLANQQINIDQGNIFLIQNNQKYEVKSNNKKPLFILKNYIGSVYKK